MKNNPKTQYMTLKGALELCKKHVVKDNDCCECEHRAIQKYTDYALLINDICELLNCEENEIIDKIKKDID